MSSVESTSSISDALSDESPATANPQPSALRTLVLMIVVIAIGAVAAVASVYFRRTQTEKTTEFWGPQGITAFQLAPMVKLEIHDGQEPGEVDLTGMPGLGHLRHALLEQRHYEWETVSAESMETRAAATTSDAAHSVAESADNAAKKPLLATLTFWDPRKPTELPPDMPVIQTTTVLVELNEGWVGPAKGDRSVRLNERSRPAVRHFLTTMRNVKQARYDDRPNG